VAKRPRRRKRKPPAHPADADPPAGATRVCTKCGRPKPLTDFFLDKRTGTPRSWCKACCNAYNRAYRRKHLDHVRARDRRYYRKYKDKQAARERRTDVQAKRAIRQAVYWAVRTGLIERPDRCARCGDSPPPHRLHAHHPDYSKPLDVVWLCSLCHGKDHARLRA
jgi:hypothetical protein